MRYLSFRLLFVVGVALSLGILRLAGAAEPSLFQLNVIDPGSDFNETYEIAESPASPRYEDANLNLQLGQPSRDNRVRPHINILIKNFKSVIDQKHKPKELEFDISDRSVGKVTYVEPNPYNPKLAIHWTSGTNLKGKCVVMLKREEKFMKVSVRCAHLYEGSDNGIYRDIKISSECPAVFSDAVQIWP